MGEVVPVVEACNGVDDDCDGQIDNGNPGGGTACNTGNPGICASGTSICGAGQLTCVADEQPALETCDGLDNDCNGTSDDGNPGGGTDCSVIGQLGPCGRGTLVCLNGTLSCPQIVFPATEQCNDVDDNCDGTVDDGDPGGGTSCNTGQSGVCAAGIAACTNGAITCLAIEVPQAEICNGLDDDCNGQTDEGNPGGGANCTVSGQFGECAKGISTCVAAMLGCPQSIMPTSEVCNDGKDNDCNGTVDDGCSSSACNINGAALPLPIALPAGAAFGTLTFDGNCDLITPGGSTGQIFRIDKNTGAVTTLVSTTLNGHVNGVAYRAQDNLIYATVENPSGLFSIPMAGGAATLVIQPKWFGAPTTLYDIVAIPPSSPLNFPSDWQFLGGGVTGYAHGVKTSTDHVDYFTYISGHKIKTLAFTPDGGALYFAQSGTNSIHRKTLGMTTIGWASFINVNGIAIDTDGSRLWATHSDFPGTEHIISEIDIASGVKTIVTKSIPFSIGLFNQEITGIVADADDEVFVKSWDGTNARIVKVP